jgi:D-glycero-alpha-D-manno-heptose 1-phosphate guanylyltransferase
MRPLTAVILAGGLGTRIRGRYPDLPKPMIPVGGSPFLEHVVRHLAREGVGRAIVSCGYKAEVIERWARTQPVAGIRVSTVREDEPLGTAGGFLEALDRTEAAGETAPIWLVENGDSLVLAALAPALEGFDRPETDAVVLGVAVPDAARFGRLEVGSDGVLRSFREKEPGAGLVNAGVYLFRRRTIDLFPRAKPLSFEREVFPSLLARGVRIEVVSVEAPFWDIGTPESLSAADAWAARHLRHQGPELSR